MKKEEEERGWRRRNSNNKKKKYEFVDALSLSLSSSEVACSQLLNGVKFITDRAV